MPQYGFYIDTSRCIGCNACVLACKQWHDIPPGPAKPMRVHQWEKGVFPDIEVNVLPIMCMHCENPRCIDACDHKAIYKEESYGAVLIDANKCCGDRNCFDACPYGAPQFLSDDPSEKMIKCTMCIDRLEMGLTPICALSCSMRALDFGLLEDLKKKYGDEGSFMAAFEPPCHNACPAGVNAQMYINHIAEGNCDEALKEYYKVTPFAGVLGRVCTHACEIDCFRGRFDSAVSVRELKRYMAEHAIKDVSELLPQKQASNGKKIAIVGSGPSGLACAYQLALLGYSVDVYERHEQPGGMMRYGMPPYRLPDKALDKEIALVKSLGVNIHTGREIKNVHALLKEYVAVYVATGCAKGVKLSVQGENMPHIHSAIDFLFELNSGRPHALGKRVAVIGGGNVAMDAARSAVRLGAERVDVISLEVQDKHSQDRMPAQEEEIVAALREGITFHSGYGVDHFERVDDGIRIACNICLSVRDERGAFRPVCETQPSHFVYADDVLIAIGQRSDETAFPTGLPKGERGPAMAEYFKSEADGIFAGGDLVSGPSDCITAIASGNEAAVSIDRYCRGGAIDLERRKIPKSSRLRVEKKSMQAPVVPMERYDTCLKESTRAFDDETALEQAQRCLRCGNMLPSVLFKREQAKKTIVPWDKQEAIALWTKRHPDTGEPLPDIIDDTSAAFEEPAPDTFCRNRLVLKPINSAEKMRYTTDDE